MNAVSLKRADEIKELHTRIGYMMRRSVKDAIQIGQLLTAQKAELNHGYFIAWIEAYLPFDRMTATRYMLLFKHRDKCNSVLHLQEAYQKVKQIEDKEKQARQKEQDRLIQERKETGQKPDDWDRATEHRYQKQLDDEAYEERKKEAFEEQKESRQERPQSFPSEEKVKLDAQLHRIQEQLNKHKHLNLNSFIDNLNQESVFRALEIYINNFETITQQLEATHNLIKKLKMIANELQVASVNPAGGDQN